ncbi:MAG: cysteine hydrolase [Dehalococcoidales bacterium]|nr:MAG: cysteine hydrolase [Dehalococcoidales bacterium]
MSKYTEPELDKAALITIDTQRDTLDGQPFEIPGTSTALSNIGLLLDIFRSHSMPIIHIVRIYQRNGSNVDICRREEVENGRQWVLEDSDGSQIATEFFTPDEVILDSSLLLSGGIQNISTNEVIIYKPRWGAFDNTPLEEYLGKLNVSTLIFTGCNYPNCPRTSIYEASERDFRIILVTDAISSLNEQGKKEMANIGVELMTAGKLADKLRLVSL